jgi:hypothetical protein
VLHTSEAKAAHLAEQQQQKLSAEIKELRTNQTQILSLLQQIAASQTAHRSSSSLQEQDLPDTSEARLESPDSGTAPPAAIPAAVAALPQLNSLHNAVLRSSKDFEHHRAVARHLLDKLVHLEAAAAQEVRWAAVAAMHTLSTSCIARSEAYCSLSESSSSTGSICNSSSVLHIILVHTQCALLMHICDVKLQCVGFCTPSN